MQYFYVWKDNTFRDPTKIVHKKVELCVLSLQRTYFLQTETKNFQLTIYCENPMIIHETKKFRQKCKKS